MPKAECNTCSHILRRGAPDGSNSSNIVAIGTLPDYLMPQPSCVLLCRGPPNAKYNSSKYASSVDTVGASPDYLVPAGGSNSSVAGGRKAGKPGVAGRPELVVDGRTLGESLCNVVAWLSRSTKDQESVPVLDVQQSFRQRLPRTPCFFSFSVLP